MDLGRHGYPVLLPVPFILTLPVHLLSKPLSGLAILLTLALPACRPKPTPPVHLAPLPQEERIQVYTNHEPASTYVEPYRQQARAGDNLEQIIVDTIASAQSTVDVAVQEFRLPNIAQALIKRKNAGVRVRVILENTYSRPFSSITPAEVKTLEERERGRYEEFRQLVDRDHDGSLSQSEIEQGDALVMLDRAKVPRIDDTADGSAGSNLMHDKFVVVDGRVVILTSANFTTSDIHGDFKSPSSRGNANNLLKFDSPELAALFTQEVNIMWGDGPGGKPDSRFGTKKPFRPAQRVTIGPTTVEVQFSPTSRSIPWSHSSNGLIAKTLSAATKSVELALFVFSDQALVNALETVHQQGVQVQALIEPGFAYRSYSEALDMLGVVLAEDCTYEAGNHAWQPAITTVGVPRLPPGDLLHHKFGIVDQQTVITGSHNWTDAANTGNDETVLVVHSPTVTAHFQREFERLNANAILGLPPAVKKKVEAQNHQCPQLHARVAPKSSHHSSHNPNARDERIDRANRAISAQVTVSSRHVQPSHSGVPHPRVNLNTATQDELEALPGVGPGLAKRIMGARQHKRFASLADLDHVSGVGPRLLSKLQNRVTW